MPRTHACLLGPVLISIMLALSSCTMTHGDANLGSHGDGLQLGGNLGVQLGGTSTSGGTGAGQAHH